MLTPTKEFAKQHYHDLKERPFFDGLCDFLSSGPVIAMVRNDSTYGFESTIQAGVYVSNPCFLFPKKFML